LVSGVAGSCVGFATTTSRCCPTFKSEVIELVPPAVQTDLTPGQATREGYLPLDLDLRRGASRSGLAPLIAWAGPTNG
jgi:short-subunit dehydrogenase involved in D-alanine esterification of teichoic acids